MSASRPAAGPEKDENAGLAVFADQTWNTPEWIARHRAMTPGERIELAVALSRTALQFAQARPLAPDDL
jgi:hypothetical protein